MVLISAKASYRKCVETAAPQLKQCVHTLSLSLSHPSLSLNAATSSSGIPLFFQAEQEARCNPCPTPGLKLGSRGTGGQAVWLEHPSLSPPVSDCKLLHTTHHRQESQHPLTVSTPVSVTATLPLEERKLRA